MPALVTDAHLHTAVSIYLLLGMQWFCLCSAIYVFYPRVTGVLYTAITVALLVSACKQQGLSGEPPAPNLLEQGARIKSSVFTNWPERRR